MNIDFAAILVGATLLTGVLWGLDALRTAPRRRAAVAKYLQSYGLTPDAKALGRLVTDPDFPVKYAESDPRINVDELRKTAKQPVAAEYARAFFPIILIVLLLRSFLVEPFRIPSGSMMPTLLVGDFILVNKFAYGIRLPVLNTKIITVGTPQRGDVVVFRYPRDPSIDYIKRIIGMPGDHLEYVNRVLYINGKPIAQDFTGTYVGAGQAASMSGAEQHLEHLNGVDHDILVAPTQPSLDGVVQVVPPGKYFAMGDNRDNSSDSRVWGFVPEENLVGKAFAIWMSWDWSNGGVVWKRIGSVVK